MITKSKIRQNAKLRISGKWSSALTILALTSAVMLLLVIGLEFTAQLLTAYHVKFISITEWNSLTTSNVFQALLPFLIAVPVLLILILIYNPLQMGGTSFYWHNANGREVSAQSALTWFRKKRYGRAVSAMFFIRVYEVLWAILCFLPAILVYPLSYSYLMDTKKYSDVLIATCLIMISALLALVGAYAFLRVIQRYFLVPYLLTAHEDMSAGEAIRISKNTMACKSAASLHFQLTFFGWFLLCFLILPFIYVIPYFKQARAEYACILLGVETAPPARTKIPFQQYANPQYGNPYLNYPYGYRGTQPQNPYMSNYNIPPTPNAYRNGYYGTPNQPPAPYHNSYYGQNPNMYPPYGTQAPNTYSGGYYYGVPYPNQYNNGYYGSGNPNPYVNHYGASVPPANSPQGYYCNSNPYCPQPPAAPHPYRNPNAADFNSAQNINTSTAPAEAAEAEPTENLKQNLDD